ncbi:hypothetical protein ECTW09195_0738, partial [Escherichia coli TW09195]
MTIYNIFPVKMIFGILLKNKSFFLGCILLSETTSF